MDRIYIALSILIVLIIGIIQILIRIRKINAKIKFSSEYLTRFNKYYSSEGSDEESYTWLTFNSNKMQDYLGVFGICDYRPPFQNYMIKNYQIILNTLTNVKNEFSSSYYFASSRRADQYADMIRESIVRFSGGINEVIIQLNKNLKNPIAWAREGIKFILSIPIILLYQFGFIDENLFEKISSSFLLKLFSAIFTVIGFIGSIIGIVTGWTQFVNILNNLTNK